MTTKSLLLVWSALFALGCTPSPDAPLDSGTDARIEQVLSPTFHPVGSLIVDGPERILFAQAAIPYVDPRPPEEIAQAACWGVKDGSHPDGWRCGPSVRKPMAPRSASTNTGAPIIPFSWTVSTWFFGVGGSDTNSCTTLGSACATFGEIETHRLGSSSPSLQQPTTFTLLNGGQVTDGAVAGQDWVFFEPNIANGSTAVLIGQLADAGTFEAGPVTAKAFPDAGQLLTVQNMGSATPGGQLVFDVTRNSYAWTDKLVDAGTMTMSQPVPASVVNTVGIPTLSEDNTWAQGDTLTLQSMPKVNLKMWRPKGGDLGDGGTNAVASAGWVQNVEITDTSGNGQSEFPLIGDSVLGMTNTRVDPRLQAGMLHGRGLGTYVINDYMASPNQNAIQSGQAEIYAGISVGSFAAQNATPTLDGDIIFHGFVTMFSSEVFVGSAYCDNVANGWNVNVSSAMKIQGSSSPHIYGTGPIVIIGPNAVVDNSGASFVSTVFTTGALSFNGRPTGCFISGLDAGVITCNVPVTIANIDANQALFDENRGSRFALQ